MSQASWVGGCNLQRASLAEKLTFVSDGKVSLHRRQGALQKT